MQGLLFHVTYNLLYHIFLSQMKEQINLDIQGMKARLQAVDSDSRLRLEQEVAGLGRQMADYQTDSRSTAASLSLRIQALEAQNAKVTVLVDMVSSDRLRIFEVERQAHALILSSVLVIFSPADPFP